MKLNHIILATIIIALFFAYAFQAHSFITCADYNIQSEQNQSAEEYAAFFKGFFIGIRCILVAGGSFMIRNKESLSSLSTIIIAYFTYTLWRSTDGLHRAAIVQAKDMRQSLDIANKTAEAALISSSSYQTTERAHLWVDKVAINEERTPTGIQLKVMYSVSNSGNTMGFIEKIPLGSAIGDNLPNIPPVYPEAQSSKSGGFVAPNQKAVWQDIAIQHITVNEYLMLRCNLNKLFIFGEVHYRDIFGALHISGFAYQIFSIQPQGQDCRLAGSAAYWKYT